MSALRYDSSGYSGPGTQKVLSRVSGCAGRFSSTAGHIFQISRLPALTCLKIKGASDEGGEVIVVTLCYF